MRIRIQLFKKSLDPDLDPDSARLECGIPAKNT
jgi:hypothetical protein